MIVLAYLIALVLVLYRYKPRFSGKHLKQQTGPSGQIYYEATQPLLGLRPKKIAFYVGLEVKNPAYFKVVTKNRAPKFSRSFGLATEIPSVDPDKDPLVLASDNPSQFDVLLQSDIARQALSTLLSKRPAAQINAFGNRLWLEEEGVTTDWLDRHRTRILRNLWEIAAALDSSNSPQPEKQTAARPARRALLYVSLHLAIGIGSLLGWLSLATEKIYVMIMTPFIFLVTVITILLGAGWFYFISLSLRGTLWRRLVRLDFLSIGILGLLVAVPLLMVKANQLLPQAAPKTEYVQAAQFFCALGCGYNNQNFGVVLSTWGEKQATHPSFIFELTPGLILRMMPARRYRENRFDRPLLQRHGISINMDEKAFNRTKRGDTFAVLVHPGALGAPWIDIDDITRVNQAEPRE